MVEAVKDGGYTIVLPETEIREGVKVAIVEDPDGNCVEFLSRQV
jgi:predicted enzyme related to lactoylglutathione lyase